MMPSPGVPEIADFAPRLRDPAVDYAGDVEAGRWLALGAWLPLTVGGALARSARERGDCTALVDPTTRLTFAELDGHTVAAAKALLATGLQPGDRVLVQVGTSTAAVVAFLGLVRAGLVPVCAVPAYRDHEMGALAALTGARGHLVEPGTAGSFDLVALAGRLRAAHPALEHVIIAPLSDALLAGAPDLDLPEASPCDVAMLQLSGGTTGVPKAIPRFHAEYLGSAAAWSERLHITAADVLLWSLPIAHNAGMLCFLMPALLHGATLVLLPRFEVSSFLETAQRERVTVSGSVGPVAPRLLDSAEPANFDLSSFRLFIGLNRGAEIEAHLGGTAVTMFGITEGLVMVSGPDDPAVSRHHAVGYPISAHEEVRILHPDAEDDVADGELGELCFRGPSTVRGYYGDAAATRAAFTSDGFFRTGDLVRARHDGARRVLLFEGRAKDNIDRGGEKFGTEAIEALLTGHPSIREARVVGMPDRHLGERVCAFVILRPGAAAPSIADLGEFLLAQGLAKFKLPERIELITDMPVTRVGKLDRAALRMRIAERLAAEGVA
jgi:non-ribosomal peptide synthetase component E (peptide arylation enzyme)